MRRSIFALAALTLLSAHAQATQISLDYRSITNSSLLPTADLPTGTVVAGIDYRNAWNGQSSAVTHTTLSSTDYMAEGTSSMMHLTVDFNTATAGTWTFQVAPDAAYGGALYLDGTRIAQNTYGMWWNNNWSNISQIFSGSLNVGAGNHVFEAIWGENCCAGNSSARFDFNGNGFQTISAVNPTLNGAAVPEPTSFALLGAAGLGLVASRRRKAA